MARTSSPGTTSALLPAQVAGVALLTDYILTVAVSVSAGVAAHVLRVSGGRTRTASTIAVGLIWIIAWMNLRGVKESGRIFAVPTYGFVVSHPRLIVVGVAKAVDRAASTRCTCTTPTVAAGAGGSLGHLPAAARVRAVVRRP